MASDNGGERGGGERGECLSLEKEKLSSMGRAVTFPCLQVGLRKVYLTIVVDFLVFSFLGDFDD